VDYVFNEENLERQRLLARNLASFTHKLLDSLSFPDHVHGLDIGCGLGETTMLLAQRAGSSNEFVGLDQNGELLAVARQKALHEGRRIEFRQGDATELPFADESFDFVFTRFLLTHIPDPIVVLREMVRVCKVGGIVAVQEPDLATYFSYPPSAAFEQYAESLVKVVPQPMVGRKLGSLFLEAGYGNCKITVESRAEFGETEYRRLDRMSMEALGPTLIARGLMDAQTIAAVCEEMKMVEQAGNSFYMRSHVISAWVERR
jgi:ubiquinone/menaquinone biosynthesis C-methylase UbiE